MKKTKNINIKVGATLFCGVEKMDLDGLGKVANALMKEMQRIQAALFGNGNSQTKRLLYTQGDIVRKRILQVEQLAKKLVKTSVPVAPQELEEKLPKDGQANPSPTGV